MECLGTLIVVGIFGVIFWIVDIIRGRQKQKEMARHSYSQIVSSWALWDDLVNCYHLDREGNRVEPSTPMKAKFMDYDTFYQYSEDDKLDMLITDFGPEKS